MNWPELVLARTARQIICRAGERKIMHGDTSLPQPGRSINLKRHWCRMQYSSDPFADGDNASSVESKLLFADRLRCSNFRKNAPVRGNLKKSRQSMMEAV